MKKQKNTKDNVIKDANIFIKKQEIEHGEIDTYIVTIENLYLKIPKIKDPIFNDFIKRIKKMLIEMEEHVKIEDLYLNEKIKVYLDSV